eukprot:jgi/Chrzof1/59/Cz01g02040.t1
MMQQRLCLIIIGSVLVASIQHATAARKGPGPTNDAYYGKVQIIAVHSKAKNGTFYHEHQLHLQLKNGEMKRLLFPTEPTKLPSSGSYVMVRATKMEHCVKDKKTVVPGNPICVASMMAHESATSDRFAVGQPRGKMVMKPLVVVLNVCNYGIPTDPESLNGVLWSDAANAALNTVQGAYKACSYGQASFSQKDGGKVLDTVVNIPCSGTTPGGNSYDSSQCPYVDWAAVADDILTKQMGINLKKYNRLIYIVPSGSSPCNFGGMGHVGCTSDCKAWLNGAIALQPAAYLHELGHNLYLNHAGVNGDNGYGDYSAAMGFCCDLRCYNTPHSYQLGWVSPLDTLSVGSFGAGRWQRYTVPAHVTSPKNFIRINPDWVDSAAAYHMFISYRKKIGYDTGLNADTGFGNRVIVYSSLASDAQPYTSFEKSLTASDPFWKEARLGSNLVVAVTDFLDNAAVVWVCRPSEDVETTCSDGYDNDCDGYIDSKDSDCQASVQSH